MPRPRINPERPLTAAERKRRQREKEKRQAKEQMRAEFEGKIQAQGYTDVREFMEAQEEDIKAFGLNESMDRGRKEYVGGGKPEMGTEELDFRKASGLSEAYKLTKELKREAQKQKKTLTTIIELTAYGKTETYLLIVAPTGKLQWKKIAEKEEQTEEDIPTKVRSKWIGAKGI